MNMQCAYLRRDPDPENEGWRPSALLIVLARKILKRKFKLGIDLLAF